MRAGLVFLAGACVAARRRAGAALRPARRARAVVGRRADARRVSSCPAPARCRGPGSRSCSSALTAGLVAAARAPQRRARADAGRAASALEPALLLDERRLHEAASPRARAGAAPAAGDRGAERGGRPAGGLLQRPCARADRGTRLRAAGARSRSPAPRTRGACRAAASAPTSSYLARARPRCSSPPRAWGGSDERRDGGRRRGPGGGRPRCSHRSCRASCSTGRRGCRAGAARAPCSRIASCGGSGARAPSTPEGTSAIYRLAPVGRRRRRDGGCARRSGCVGRSELGVGHDALAARRAARARAVRRRRLRRGTRATASR